MSEYRLLKAINGKKCVLNLYGDINQSVYIFKGIQNWEDIRSIAGDKIYVLNENYRNTVQITEYCNKEFDAEVVPIGITGYNVLEMTTAFAVEWIKKIKKQNPSHRTAIIYRYGMKEIQDALHELLKDADVSWSVVDNNKLSVISVETAKGLEFEEVVAIVSQMTNNEKYISFTRALNNLVVVRDSYTAELSDENEAEDTIEAEFTEPLMENLDDEISNVTESESPSEIPDLTISDSAKYEIAYIDVMNPKKSERVNYLTNSFTGGSMPILITTQKIGTYLSNPRLRFIIHYDIPSDRKEYQLHISQIGKLAAQPVVYDFIIG